MGSIGVIREQVQMIPHAEIDPLAPGFLADPYPHLARQREAAPVAYCDDLDMWVVTRWADVDTVFRDHETFSAGNVQAPLLPFAVLVLPICFIAVEGEPWLRGPTILSWLYSQGELAVEKPPSPVVEQDSVNSIAMGIIHARSHEHILPAIGVEITAAQSPRPIIFSTD